MPRLLLPVILVALFAAFFRLGSVTLFDVDEAVFATATKEMVLSGDWVTPTYNGENRYDKPILFYWVMAVPYLIFGVGEFSARFPSAVAAVLLVAAVFLFVLRFKDERSAMYAALPMSLSVYFFVYSHAAVTDMALTLFITLSLMSFYLAVSRPISTPSPQSTPVKGEGEGVITGKETSIKSKRYLYGFYFFSALAFLTKGLIGILFPFGIVMVFLFVTEGKRGLRKLISLKGLFLFLIVSAPWYAAQLMINGNEFVNQFFVKHHFMRYTGVISGHKGPFYYYLPALISGLFPWIAFMPGGITAAFKERDRLLLFASVWAAFVVLFFSISTTKLPNYVLPAVPALVVLISSGMSVSRPGRFAYVAIAAVSLALSAVFFLSPKHLLRFGVQETGWTGMAAAVMLAMTAVCLYALIARTRPYALISGIMAAFLLVVSVEALPLASKHLQGALFRYSVYAKERLGKGDLLIAYGINNPSIVFYSGHRVKSAGSREEILPLLKSGANLVVITKTKHAETLIEAGFGLIEAEGRYALLEKRF